MYDSSFDVQNAQSVRLQKAEIPTLKFLLISQIGKYLDFRTRCFSERKLDPMSVQSIMAILEDLHTLITLRDYKTSSLEINHVEKFKELVLEYKKEIEILMSKKVVDENSQMKASISAMNVLNKIFHLETRYLDRFGLLEPEDVTFTQEDAEIDIISEDYQEVKKEYTALKEKGESMDDYYDRKPTGEFVVGESGDEKKISDNNQE